MPAMYLQPILPWSGPQPEDLRFRRILAAVLTLFLLLGAIMPHLQVAVVETDVQADLPPRMAYIIAEPIAPPPTTIAVPRPRQATAAQDTLRQKAPAPAPKQKPSPPASVAAPPAKVIAKTGLLALTDALNTMRQSTPSIAADPSLSSTAEGADRTPVDARESLIAGVTEGSGGIGVGTPTHQQILGTTGRPIGGLAPGRGRGALGDRTGVQAPRETPGGRPGKVRTEEQIQEILNRHKRAIYRLYNRELLADPSLHGKLVARITIAPSGKVTECRIVYSELQAQSFEQALTSLIKRIDFGAKPDVPLVTTRVPIEFFPT